MKEAAVPIVVFSVVALALSGCRESVLVGVVLPLSGEHRIYGESVREGLELAWDELRARGDTPVELRVVDSESDPRKGRKLLAQLYRDGAIAAVGGLTVGEAEAMAPVAEDFGRVLLSPSASLRDQREGARHFFSLAPAEAVTGTTMASFAARELGVRKAVVVRDPEMATEALEEGFRKTLAIQGGELVATLEASGEVASTVAEVLAHRPDAVYLAADEAAVGELVRELRAQKFAGEILTTQAFACRDSIRRLGDAAAHVLLTRTAFHPEDDDPRVARFVERYRVRYGGEPDVFAAEAYDALSVLARALEGRPALASEVRKGLQQDIVDFAGVTGSIRFDDTRGVPRIPRVYGVTEELSLRDQVRWLQAERDWRDKREEELLQRLRDLRKELADRTSTDG